MKDKQPTPKQAMQNCTYIDMICYAHWNDELWKNNRTGEIIRIRVYK